MSTQLCTGDYMFSDSVGTGLAKAWFPRLVAERYATSTRDGPVERAPDPIPFIDTDLSWVNASGNDQHIYMSVHLASRSLVSSNPNTLVLQDATSWDIGPTPKAPTPSNATEGFGTRLNQTPSVTATIQFARIFTDIADSVYYDHIGLIAAGDALHYRYRCLFSTPGAWRVPIQPRHEAWARYVRLRLWTGPMLTAI